MPFTPVHMGPALTFKLIGRGGFSLTLFGYSQVLMDIEPLLRLLGGADVVHGISHTYPGAVAVAVVACASGKPICEWGLREWNRSVARQALQVPARVSWPVAASSALIGTLSHVLLDSVMHADLQPWRPFAGGNEALEAISTGQLHLLCAVLGGIGLAGLAGWWWWRGTRARRS